MQHTRTPDRLTGVGRRQALRTFAITSVGLFAGLGTLAGCGGTTVPTAASGAASTAAAASSVAAPTGSSVVSSASSATSSAAATTTGTVSTGGVSVGSTTSPLPAPAAASGEAWTLGKAPASSTATFHALSWEGTGKIEKWQLAIKPFFATYYPKMQVQFDWGIPFAQFWTKLQTQLAGGVAPDMAWMHITRNATFAALGQLVPLDTYLKQLPPPGWPEQYYRSQVEAFQYQGKQYSLPYDWAPGGFYVNADLFAKAGAALPTETTTFDDLLALAQKLTKSTGDPKTSQWGVNFATSSNGSYWMVRDFGGDTVAGSPPAAHLTDPQTIAAYQYLWDLMYKYKVMPTPQDSSDLGGDATHLFVAGKLAMNYDLDDAANSLAQAVNGQFKLTVAPTPKGPGKRVQNAGGSSFAIPKGSGQPDVAYELMRWIIANPALLPKIAADPSGGTFVSNMQFWKDGLPAASTGIPDDAFAHTFHDLGLRDGVPPAHFDGYVQWDADIYTKNLSVLWTGQERDVAKALANVQAQTTQLLQSVQRG